MNLKIVLKFGFFFIFLLLLQIVASYILIGNGYKNSEVKELLKFASRIKNDLVIKNDTIDTSFYNSDPYTPSPNGSSGFSQPLYIITTDGFVLERNLPIEGFLDTSDYKRLVAFTTPQTIKGATSESWRVLSRTISLDNQEWGAVLVSYYQPSDKISDDIDEKLKNNLSILLDKIYLKNNELSIDKIDVRNVHYDVSFEVVDKYNRVLLNNGRIPTFIDRSYIYQELNRKKEIFEYQNPKNHKKYLLVEKVAYYNNNPRLIIIVGQPESTSDFLRDYLAQDFIVHLVFLIPLILVTFYIVNEEIRKEVETAKSAKDNYLPKSISFDKKEAVISYDNEKVIIPKDSNQYFICKTLFSNPKKRFHLDELLDKLGDHDYDNWRKIYDSVLAINKRLPFKLISYENKNYFLNPKLTLI